MRKVILLSSLSLLTFFSVSAQDGEFKLGIKAAPVIGSSRVLLDNPEIEINSDGSAFKFSFGLVVDKFFGDNYVISSGLIYIPKQVALTFSQDPTAPLIADPINESETYKLQYLQIPATVKLFTNEISPDMKMYFQLGMALDFKVYEEADPELNNPEMITKFQPINIPVVLGTGLEYRAGINTVLFAGASYQRGLNNIVQNVNHGEVDELEIRSTVFSIDLGVKF